MRSSRLPKLRRCCGPSKPGYEAIEPVYRARAEAEAAQIRPRRASLAVAPYEAPPTANRPMAHAAAPVGVRCYGIEQSRSSANWQPCSIAIEVRMTRKERAMRPFFPISFPRSALDTCTRKSVSDPVPGFETTLTASRSETMARTSSERTAAVSLLASVMEEAPRDEIEDKPSPVIMRNFIAISCNTSGALRAA